MGEGMVELSLVVAELSAALMPVASALALHLGVAEAIQRLGTDDQRERYLPSMANYDTVGVLGLSETNTDSSTDVGLRVGLAESQRGFNAFTSRARPADGCGRGSSTRCRRS
jgi:alkylation response protein AidB-like acyl-CoA dehydrogenase